MSVDAAGRSARATTNRARRWDWHEEAETWEEAEKWLQNFAPKPNQHPLGFEARDPFARIHTALISLTATRRRTGSFCSASQTSPISPSPIFWSTW